MVSSLHIDPIVALREGKEEGFNYFFNAYYKRLHFFATGYTKDKDAAEDIVSDSFIKLWNNREKIETEAGLRGYLYKSAYNACLRWLWQKNNRATHHKVIALQTDITDPDCLHSIIKAETLHLLHEAIEQLPPQCKTVFTKLYVEGKTVAETADEMGIAVSTVKNQKGRGIKLLKPKLAT